MHRKTLSEFSAALLEESRWLLASAQNTSVSTEQDALLHSSVLVAFAAFEAHVSIIADEFLERPELTAHERGLLAERSVELVEGEFAVSETMKIQRIEDRVLFICKKFSNSPIDKKDSRWSEFKHATQLRNRLTHPKVAPDIEVKDVERTLQALVEMLNWIYLNIYKKGLPSYRRGVKSKLLS